MKKKNIRFITISFIIIALTFVAYRIAFVKLDHNVSDAEIGGSFSLTNTNNQQVTLENLKGKYSLVFFGFTHCPMICPTALGTLSETYRKLSAKQKQKVNLVFITLDPERDTSQYLKEYISSFNSPIIALTGSVSDINETAKKYKIYFEKKMLGDNDYTINHSSLIYILDKKGKFHSHFPYSVDSNEIYQELNQLL